MARVSDIDKVDKVRKAGADAVVSPDHIGGLRLASELIRPTVVSFLDTMLRDKDANRRIDEIAIPEGSASVGRALHELDLELVGSALLLAMRTATDEWVYNPPKTHRVQAGEILIFLGSPEEIGALCDQLDGAVVAKPSAAPV